MIREPSTMPEIHPTVVVEDGAKVGPGTRIGPLSHVGAGARIGTGCGLGQNVRVGPGVVVGDGSKIHHNASLPAGVTLERDVLCGPSMVVASVLRPRAAAGPEREPPPTRVGRGATLGAHCTILCGVTVGRFAMVGAGAVVTRDLPDFALAYGVPARQHGWVCRCGVKLAMGRRDGICHACGAEYTLAAPGRLERKGS